METEELVLFPLLMLLLGWALWLFYRRGREQREISMRRIDLQREVVRKFQDADGFMAFLRSEEGRRCFPDDPHLHPKTRHLRGISLGVVLILFGIAMILYGYSWRSYTDINFVQKMYDYYYWGTITMSAGAGLVFHAVLSLWLGRRWKTGSAA